MEKKNLDYNLIIKGVLVVGGLYTGYKVLNTLFTGLGLIKSKDETDLDNNINSGTSAAADAFNPAYYRDAKAKGKIIKDLSLSDQNLYKTQLYNCIGYIFDSPYNCLTVFQKLSYKTQVSVLADAFQNAYGSELLGYLLTKLDTDKQRTILNQILKRVGDLPSGIS